VSEKNSFRGTSLFKKTFAITALTFLIILLISFVFGTYFFGLAGIFSIFGVNYDSFNSLLIFFIFFLFLGSMSDLFANILIRLSTLYISGEFNLFITRMLIDCTFTWLALYTVDEFMNSITIPFTTEIVVALLLFFIQVAFDDKKEK
jgi:hypothetical protein